MVCWPDPHDAASLLPVPRSPSSVSNDSFSSSQQTVAAAAAAVQGADAGVPGEDDEDVPTPRRPRTAYILFTQAVRDRVKRDLEAKKGHKLSDGPKIMGKSGKVGGIHVCWSDRGVGWFKGCLFERDCALQPPPKLTPPQNIHNDRT